MYKILATLLIPLLIAMPISEVSRAYILSQNCQNLVVVQKIDCDCSTNQMKINIFEDSPCCCLKSGNKGQETPALISEANPFKLILIASIEFSKPFDLSKKINIIEEYSIYYSAGISTSETNVYYSPPIYQQICSLRI